MKYNASELRDLWNKLLLSQNIEVCSDKLKGCGMLELKILKLLFQNSSYKIKDILKVLGIPNSTATNVINRLTEKELLQRKLNANDLRSFELELTEKGKSAVTEHLAAETIIFENMLRCLSDNEKEVFVNLFGKIVSHILIDT